jgi:integrase/recombinase XerD
MNLDAAITNTVANLHTTNTATMYKYRLEQFQTWHEAQESPPNIDFSLVLAYMAALGNSSPSVKAQALAALKKLCLTLKADGKLKHPEYLEIKALQAPANQPALVGKHLSDDDMGALLKACLADKNPILAARDAAILATLQATGMRRAELTNLTQADYDSEKRRLQLRNTKGKHDRAAFLNPIADNYLKRWLMVRGSGAGPLFYKVNRKGGLTTNPLGPSAIYYTLKKRCLEAGLAESYTPHDLRHTYITNLLAANIDIALVSRLAGHSSVIMTARYDTRREDEMRQAASKVYTPEIA